MPTEQNSSSSYLEVKRQYQSYVWANQSDLSSKAKNQLDALTQLFKQFDELLASTEPLSDMINKSNILLGRINHLVQTSSSRDPSLLDFNIHAVELANHVTKFYTNKQQELAVQPIPVVAADKPSTVIEDVPAGNQPQPVIDEEMPAVEQPPETKKSVIAAGIDLDSCVLAVLKKAEEEGLIDLNRRNNSYMIQDHQQFKQFLINHLPIFEPRADQNHIYLFSASSRIAQNGHFEQRIIDSRKRKGLRDPILDKMTTSEVLDLLKKGLESHNLRVTIVDSNVNMDIDDSSDSSHADVKAAGFVKAVAEIKRLDPTANLDVRYVDDKQSIAEQVMPRIFRMQNENVFISPPFVYQFNLLLKPIGRGPGSIAHFIQAIDKYSVAVTAAHDQPENLALRIASKSRIASQKKTVSSFDPVQVCTSIQAIISTTILDLQSSKDKLNSNQSSFILFRLKSHESMIDSLDNKEQALQTISQALDGLKTPTITAAQVAQFKRVVEENKGAISKRSDGLDKLGFESASLKMVKDLVQELEKIVQPEHIAAQTMSI